MFSFLLVVLIVEGWVDLWMVRNNYVLHCYVGNCHDHFSLVRRLFLLLLSVNIMIFFLFRFPQKQRVKHGV